MKDAGLKNLHEEKYYDEYLGKDITVLVGNK